MSVGQMGETETSLGELPPNSEKVYLGFIWLGWVETKSHTEPFLGYVFLTWGESEEQQQTGPQGLSKPGAKVWGKIGKK